jgi:hypothetical protein
VSTPEGSISQKNGEEEKALEMNTIIELTEEEAEHHTTAEKARGKKDRQADRHTHTHTQR